MTDVAEPERGVFATTEQKVTRWRLTVLTRAYGDGTFDDEVFAQLDALAQCKADLWQIEKALKVGCGLALAVDIFT